MPSPLACGVIYLIVSGVMLIPAFVPWAAVPLSTSAPTLSPTLLPTTLRPTFSPTHVPTLFPTQSPTFSPTTSRPSKSPSRRPTSRAPSGSPTVLVSSQPSFSPSITTSFPSAAPSKQPIEGRRRRRQLQAAADGDPRLVWLLWLWPFLANLLMGISYIIYDPSDVTTHRAMGVYLLGKELDGSQRWYCVIFMFPVLVPLWFYWYLRHSTWLRNQRPYDEVAPGIYLGRFPATAVCSRWTKEETFPESCSTIVDLVSEMPVPRSVYKGRRYICIPTLDQCPPNVEALREVGSALSSHSQEVSGTGNSNSNFRRLNSNEDVEGEGVQVRGSVFVFCANGRGRSAIFVMVMLVMRGDCDSVEEALEIIKKARPQVHPKEEQIHAAREAVSVWKAEQLSKKSGALRSSEKTAKRKRSLSNTEPIHMISEADVMNEVIMSLSRDATTGSRGGAEEKEPHVKGTKRPVDDNSPNRKRKLGGVSDLKFDLVQPVYGETAPVLEISYADVEFIASQSLIHLDKEAGGELLGNPEATVENGNKQFRVMQALGPSRDSEMTATSFVQDKGFAQQALEIVAPFNFLEIGSWRSRYDSVVPGERYSSIVMDSMKNSEKQNYVSIIINIPSEGDALEVAAYLFSKEFSPGKMYEQFRIQIIPMSKFNHDHQLIHGRIEAIREGGPTYLRHAEYSSQAVNPLPEPHIQSTESKNVIDLALQ